MGLVPLIYEIELTPFSNRPFWGYSDIEPFVLPIPPSFVVGIEVVPIFVIKHEPIPECHVFQNNVLEGVEVDFSFFQIIHCCCCLNVGKSANGGKFKGYKSLESSISLSHSCCQ